jgi:hypothetical protein
MLDEHRNQSEPTGPTPQSFGAFAADHGLDPFVATGMVAADWMLFGGLELPSLGALAVVSFFVGLALIIPCALIQHYAYGDGWGAAIGKAMLVGLLTAIPSSLPSFVTAGWGIVGAIGKKHRAQSRTIDTTGSEVN